MIDNIEKWVGLGLVAFGASGHPTGSARFPNTSAPIPAGTIAVDDVSIGVRWE